MTSPRPRIPQWDLAQSISMNRPLNRSTATSKQMDKRPMHVTCVSSFASLIETVSQLKRLGSGGDGPTRSFSKAKGYSIPESWQ